MIQTFELFPGGTLRCFPDQRFKHGCLSIQLLRPMDRGEAALNALLPAVLLRGSRSYPDLRDITLRLDDLYGASVGALVRRVGDWQTTGFYAGFTEDRFAMEGDRILAPMVELLRELLEEPLTEKGIFRDDYVKSEKKNLISTIESQLNDKRAWAMEQLIGHMCGSDTLGIPRLGDKASVAAITPKRLYDHYRRILAESPMALFYVGSEDPEKVARLLRQAFSHRRCVPAPLPPQTPCRVTAGLDKTQSMDVSQGKLCMGFSTPVTCRDEGFVATQVMNMIFGGGMTSKLFCHIREKLSLCYAIGSGYIGTKGIVTVSAGIDSRMDQTVRREILGQLEAICRGDISEEEITAAKQALRSSLLATHDSPGAIENYYSGAALSGLDMTPEQYLQQVEQTTPEEICRAAQQLQLQGVFFLKGVDA